MHDDRYSHRFLLFSLFPASILWILALISQGVVTATISNDTVGVLWFAVILQLLLTIALLYAISTRTLGFYCFQLSILAGMIIVFATFGVNMNIFSKKPWQDILSAAWLLILVLDVVWFVCFSLGQGHPKPDADLDRGIESGSVELGPQTNSEKQLSEGLGVGGSQVLEPPPHTHTHPYLDRPQTQWTDSAIGPNTSGEISTLLDTRTLHPPQAQPPANNNAIIPNHLIPVPLDGGGSDRDTARYSLNAPTTQTASSSVRPGDFTIRVEALYNYQASESDPDEISFRKGDILYVPSTMGKWWEARDSKGVVGIVPSNYLRVL